MGQAHVVLSTAWLGELRKHPHLITFLRISIWDDASWVCLVESQFLPDGYHGEQVVVRESSDPLTISFMREMDT